MMLERTTLTIGNLEYAAEAVYNVYSRELIIRFSDCPSWWIEQILDNPGRYFQAANQHGTFNYYPNYSGSLNKNEYVDKFASNNLVWRIHFEEEEVEYEFPSNNEYDLEDPFIKDESSDSDYEPE